MEGGSGFGQYRRITRYIVSLGAGRSALEMASFFAQPTSVVAMTASRTIRNVVLVLFIVAFSGFWCQVQGTSLRNYDRRGLPRAATGWQNGWRLWLGRIKTHHQVDRPIGRRQPVGFLILTR